MDTQPAKKSRDEESFNMGALAVDKTDLEATRSQLGRMALSNTELVDLLEPGEEVVTVIKRHPIGIIGIYIEMISGVSIILILLALGLAGTFGQLSGNAKAVMAVGAIFGSTFLVLILLISAYVYRQSRILVADKSLISRVQNALFSKKIARLSMANVEDVTCDQRGILQSLFNYGTLTIQTAGQEDNFIFPFCPNPDKTADKILEARQAFVVSHDKD